ncbi:hypothetical protein C0J52_02195 [Blattella germanica]|nr:hypothetical protein C0J52_02195 [Blattella germanica]
MMTSTILLLLVAAASTIAFSPPSEDVVISPQDRRVDQAQAPWLSQAAPVPARPRAPEMDSLPASAPGADFHPTKYLKTGPMPLFILLVKIHLVEQSSNSVGAGVYNSVNPGAYGSNDFNFPNPAYNQYPNQYGGGYPDFNRFFQEYMAFMQRLAQQQAAYVPNGNGNLHPGPNLTSWMHYGTWSTPAPIASAPQQHASSGQLSQSPMLYNTPASSAHLTKHVSTPTYTATRRYFSTPKKRLSRRVSKRKSNFKRLAKSKRNHDSLISNPQFNIAPIATKQYYNTPSSTALHFRNPNASSRQLQSSSYTLAPSGQPMQHHFSKSSAIVSLNTAGEIHSRGAFGPDDFTGAQNGFYFPGPNNYGGNYGGNFGGNPNDGNVHASASASLTPRGGFGSASISPPPQGDPGLATRMGSVPSSGGGNFAVFSSSSSGSSDVNGERKTYKEATSVINDNGKVTTFHVSDP